MRFTKVARLPAGGIYKGVIEGAKAPEPDVHRDRDDALFRVAEEAYRLRDTQIIQVFAVTFPGMELEIAAETVGMKLKGSRKGLPRNVLGKILLQIFYGGIDFLFNIVGNDI